MARQIKIKKAFDEFAEEYDKFMQETGHTATRNKILQELQTEINGKVLDVATGTGEVALWIAKNTKAREVEGVDFSGNMIQKAREKVKKERLNINFSLQNIENLTFPDKVFDVVLCCLGVCWFTHRKKALEEMKRVCNDQGKIILLEEEGTALAVQRLVKEEAPLSEKIKVFEELEEYIPIDEIKKLMCQINCKLIKETDLVPIDRNHSLRGLVFAP